MRAEITTWHKEVRWGFATTQQKKIVFVHESAFRDHRQVAGVRYGTLIEFDLPVTQTAEQAFLDKLNTGRLRDEKKINHRNPRRTNSYKRPRAINVTVAREIQK